MEAYARLDDKGVLYEGKKKVIGVTP